MPPEDAIQNADVSSQGNDELELDPRDEAIAEIAKDRAQERDEMLKENGFEPEVADGEVEPDPDEVSAETTSQDGEPGDGEESEPPADNEEETHAATKKRTLKVDGEEVEFDEDKIIDAGIRALQKESAADKRLEEATELLRQAKALSNNQNEQQNSQPPVTTQGAETPTLATDEAKAIANAIQYGDEEESAEAIQKIFGRSQATQEIQQLSPADIQKAVSDQLAFNSAIEMLEKPPEDGGFGDLMSDPMLSKMVADKEAELRTEKEWGSYHDLFTAAGNAIREWRNDLIGKSSGNVSDIKSRQQRKASANSTVSSASTTSSPAAPEKPKSTSDIIEEMRRSRSVG